MIEISALNQLLFDAFTGKITWLEASARYTLDEFIQAFYNTRATMQKTITGLTDAQAAYTAPDNAAWSLSETITHLVYSQNFYHNQLLEITTSQSPHLAEAAQGFGEGAKRDISAETLQRMLEEATQRIRQAIENTRSHSDPLRITNNFLFGKVNYPTWILLLLGHEVDHVRQSIVMRRMARALLPG